MSVAPPPKFTGLRCPSRKQAIALIENQTPTTLTMRCPACGHRWSGTEPGTKPHQFPLAPGLLESRYFDSACSSQPFLDCD